MSYFILTFLVWLLLEATSFDFSFNPTLIAFLVALVIDLLVYKPWTKA